MRPATQTDLRRTVRRMVYTSCRRTLDSSEAILASEVVADIRAELGSAEESGLTDETLEKWITEDENAFENAVLISELVAKNVGNLRPAAAGPPPEPRQRAATTTATRPAVAEDRKPRNAPGIADLLDDMLSQQRERR